MFALYLIGFAPLLLARKWPARLVAIVFGFLSLGLFFYLMSNLHKIPHPTKSGNSAQILFSPFLPLLIAFASSVVTYLIDKKPDAEIHENAIENKQTQIRKQLYAGGGLLILFLFVIEPLSRWSSVEREIWGAFASGAVASLPVVVLMPFLLRGSAWERILASTLLILPILARLGAFATAIHYR